MPSISLSVAITNMTLLLFFSSVHNFSMELFFLTTVRVSQVIFSLKNVKNKNICQYDVMNIYFLINCMLRQ